MIWRLRAKRDVARRRQTLQDREAAASHAKTRLQEQFAGTVASPAGLAGCFAAGLVLGASPKTRALPRRLLSGWQRLTLLAGLGHKLLPELGGDAKSSQGGNSNSAEHAEFSP